MSANEMNAMLTNESIKRSSTSCITLSLFLKSLPKLIEEITISDSVASWRTTEGKQGNTVVSSDILEGIHCMRISDAWVML